MDHLILRLPNGLRRMSIKLTYIWDCRIIPAVARFLLAEASHLGMLLSPELHVHLASIYTRGLKLRQRCGRRFSTCCLHQLMNF